jgi:hypothetical protein
MATEAVKQGAQKNSTWIDRLLPPAHQVEHREVCAALIRARLSGSLNAWFHSAAHS